MATHTPGPFVASKGIEDEPERWVVLVDGPRQWFVATIENGAPGDTLETEAANAHLFAAAPDLLAACEAVEQAAADGAIVSASGDYIESRGAHAVLHTVRQAIAKAKGTP